MRPWLTVRLGLAVKFVALLVCLVALGCAGGYRVERIVDGELSEGRFVSDIAYAAYARGALLEADGKLGAAREAYRSALEEDPQSVELLSVLGALDCRLFPNRPWTYLDAARRRDPSYEPQWRERAECHRLRGELDAARADLLRALSLDPERVGTSERMLTLLESSGEDAAARRWLRGLVLLFPGNQQVRSIELAYAKRHGNARAERRAERRLVRSLEQESCDLRSLDKALSANDLVLANRCALSLGLDASVVAFRALCLGKRELAARQARAASRRDPADPNAAVALALSSSEPLLAPQLAAPPEAVPVANRGVLNDWARYLFAERLEWHVGKPAAIAWLDATAAVANQPEPEPDDPLFSDLVARVHVRLGLGERDRQTGPGNARAQSP